LKLIQQLKKFAEIISTDKRAATLDAGNIKLTFNSLIEKAVLKEKERLKEEARKQKRLEANFKQLLKTKFDSLTEQSKWEELKQQIENDEDYHALSSEFDRIRLFDEYHRQFIADSQQSHHHHKRKKKKRKHEKTNSSESDNDERSPESDEGETKDSDGDTPVESKVKKNKKSKKKHKKKSTSSESETDDESTKKKKKK